MKFKQNTLFVVLFMLVNFCSYFSCFNYGAKERVAYENARMADYKAVSGLQYIDPSSEEVKKIFSDGKIFLKAKVKFYGNWLALFLAFVLFLWAVYSKFLGYVEIFLLSLPTMLFYYVGGISDGVLIVFLIFSFLGVRVRSIRTNEQ